MDNVTVKQELFESSADHQAETLDGYEVCLGAQAPEPYLESTQPVDHSTPYGAALRPTPDKQKKVWSTL